MSWIREHSGLVAVVVTVIVVLLVLAILDRALARQEEKLRSHYRGDFDSAKTRFRLIRRLASAIVIMIGVIAAVLEFAPAFGQTLLASSAVLAIVAGFAVRTPLANLAAGVQLALTQPFRLGDRIVVGAESGVVDEIKVAYTVLRTDDGRRAFLPNEQVIASPIVNATIEDPIRAETVRIPVSLDADLPAVLADIQAMAASIDGPVRQPAPSVRVDDVTTGAVIVAVTLWVADGQLARAAAAELRRQVLGNLRERKALARA
jgi:small-conductance mechanosensitive channel